MGNLGFFGNVITDASTIFGEAPNGSFSDDIQQHHAKDCAVRSQEIVLRDFGINENEDDLCTEAENAGWFSEDGGTPLRDVGNLLESHGVPVTRCDNANVFNLTSELAQGHRIIVAVDSAELWGDRTEQQFVDMTQGEMPDHALIVAGIDTSDPNNPQVILTDPGSGAEAQPYPMDQFVDAWQDSRCYMVSTDIPASGSCPGMENFNYDTGHIDTIGDLSYDDFMAQFEPYFGQDGQLDPFLSAGVRFDEVFQQFLGQTGFDESLDSDDCSVDPDEGDFSHDSDDSFDDFTDNETDCIADETDEVDDFDNHDDIDNCCSGEDYLLSEDNGMIGLF